MDDCLSPLTAATPLTDLLPHDSLSFIEQIPDSFWSIDEEKKKETKKKKKKDKEKQSSQTTENQIGNKSPNSSESSLDSAALEKLRDYLIQYLSRRTDQECNPENLQMLLDPDIVSYLSQQLKHQRAQSIQTIGAFQRHSLFGRMLQRGGWKS